jgi:hypothetical protein
MIEPPASQPTLHAAAPALPAGIEVDAVMDAGRAIVVPEYRHALKPPVPVGAMTLQGHRIMAGGVQAFPERKFRHGNLHAPM